MTQSFVRNAKLLLALAAIILHAPGQASSQSKELIEFNYGTPLGTYHATLVAKEAGLYEQEGLAPKFFNFQSGAPMLAALKSKSLDVITTGLGTVFALGQGIPLKIMYWEIDNGAAEALIVSPDSEIKTLEDLPKAKAIGAMSGTCGQVSLVLIAKKLGIPYRSLNLVNIAPPMYGNAFTSKSIDAGIAWSPFSIQLEQQGYRVVEWAPQYTPDGGICPAMTSVRPEFLEKHPDIGVKMLKVRDKALKMMADDPELVIQALMKRFSISREVAKATYEKESPKTPSFQEQLDPNSSVSLTAGSGKGLSNKLRVASEALAEAGSIPAPLSMAAIDDAIDPSHLQRFMKGESQ
ncbi:MAG: ABC transporter substrate-binding protein [Burkholderiaceae bacterium]|nr:ABC transporter substrate-binding protein [Burkholderiaceae bacterium]